MSIKKEIHAHLSKFHTAPFLFVGSGISRRYLGLEDWNGLLQRFSSIIGKPFEFYRASANGHLPSIASEIAKDFHSIWWHTEKFEKSREEYKGEAINKESALKIEIARYLERISINRVRQELIQDEINLLRSVVVDGIITTNWDLFLENIFPDFQVFVGQEELIFSSPQAIGEIYKIHGCCSKPNSLVITNDDYTKFNERNPYLAAKLLTVFVEHPVICLGYSLNDTNIAQILKSIASCLTNSNIDKLRDGLILVQWKPELDEYQIRDSNIIIDGLNIPVKTITITSFIPLYEALAELPRKFPAKLLRRLKEHVYNLVQENDPKDQLYVQDIEDDSNLSELKVVFGVGIRVVKGGIPKESKDVRLTDDPNAVPVRLVDDPDAKELPYRISNTTGSYNNLQEELVGAVRAWKTDPMAFTPASQLWKFYIARKNLILEEDSILCLLVSSMHRNCPVHYWASLLKRDKLAEFLREQVQKDQFPNIRYAARLAFAMGLSDGETILDEIANSAKSKAVRILASRLRSEMEQGSTVWREYRSPVVNTARINGEEVVLNIFELNELEQAEVDEIISKLAMSQENHTRAKQLDALFYGML